MFMQREDFNNSICIDTFYLYRRYHMRTFKTFVITIKIPTAIICYLFKMCRASTNTLVMYTYTHTLNEILFISTWICISTPFFLLRDLNLCFTRWTLNGNPKWVSNRNIAKGARKSAIILFLRLK